MTDLPLDDEGARRRRRKFLDAVVLKFRNQHNIKLEFQAWNLFYESLGSEERIVVDIYLEKACAEVAAQFGKSKKYKRP